MKKETWKTILSRVTIVALTIVFVASCAYYFTKDKRGETRIRYYLESPIIPTGHGEAYIPPYIYGDTVVLKGAIINAAITPDKKNIVVLEADGTLFLSDSTGKRTKTITGKAFALLAIHDKGFFYEDLKGRIHRYLFADGTDLAVGKSHGDPQGFNYVIADNELTIAIGGKRHKIYVLTPDMSEAKAVASYKGKLELRAVSNDGDTIVYADSLEDGPNLKLYCDKETTILESIPGRWYLSSFISAGFNQDDNILFITWPYEFFSFVKRGSEEPQKIDMSFDSSIFTGEGNITHLPQEQIDQFYVQDCWKNTLHSISADGTSTCILDDPIRNFFIKQNTLYYITDNGDCYIATIDETTVSDAKLFAQNATSRLYITEDGYYIYYFSEDDGDEASHSSDYQTLYRYSVQEDACTQIDTNVNCNTFKLIYSSAYDIAGSHGFVYATDRNPATPSVSWIYYDGNKETAFIPRADSLGQIFDNLYYY